MITEFDIPIPRIADIYSREGWYPAKEPGDTKTDTEEKVREVLVDLLRSVTKEYRGEEYFVETMRLKIERVEDTGAIYLRIGSVEW